MLLYRKVIVKKECVPFGLPCLSLPAQPAGILLRFSALCSVSIVSLNSMSLDSALYNAVYHVATMAIVNGVDIATFSRQALRHVLSVDFPCP